MFKIQLTQLLDQLNEHIDQAIELPEIDTEAKAHAFRIYTLAYLTVINDNQRRCQVNFEIAHKNNCPNLRIYAENLLEHSKIHFRINKIHEYLLSICQLYATE